MKSSLRALCASLAFFISTPAFASDWVIDPLNSVLGFEGKQGGAPFQGSFKRWSGRISFDPANPGAGSATIDIDMTSGFTNSREKDEALPESDWFNAKAFPQARFEATSFRPKGGNAFEAPGVLTIRGIHKEVVLPFTLDIKGDEAHAKGALNLVRTDYGVGQGQWKTGDTVALDVRVILEIKARKKP